VQPSYSTALISKVEKLSNMPKSDAHKTHNNAVLLSIYLLVGVWMALNEAKNCRILISKHTKSQLWTGLLVITPTPMDDAKKKTDAFGCWKIKTINIWSHFAIHFTQVICMHHRAFHSSNGSNREHTRYTFNPIVSCSLSWSQTPLLQFHFMRPSSKS
jgi:hypothetical protein